eukprot:scaffold120025_cov30-Phaeocystis_antarctica.AAC.1
MELLLRDGGAARRDPEGPVAPAPRLLARGRGPSLLRRRLHPGVDAARPRCVEPAQPRALVPAGACPCPCPYAYTLTLALHLHLHLHITPTPQP